jgi:hypothetical protein
MIRRQVLPLSKTILLAFALAFTTSASAVTASEVSATRLDGTNTKGELRQWNAADIVIATATGDERIATNQLASLNWHPHGVSPATGDKNGGIVELIDGTTLPCKSIFITQSQVTVKLAIPKRTDNQSLTLPAKQVSAIRFRTLDAPLAKQWDEMLRLNLASDVLAVLKKDGKSLDYVEGIIGDVTEDKIEFKLEGASQRVDRGKIAGIVYYRPDRRMTRERQATIHGRSGFRSQAAALELNDTQLQITTVAGIKLTWALDDITSADFSAGKLMYLSDIEAASEKWTPLVALPSTAKLAAEYGQPRRDKSAYGGPLTLLMKADALADAQENTRTFNKGVAIRSRTEIVYRLPAGFQRFTALAGIDPATSANGNVRLIISADDRVILDTEIAGNEPAQPIQLEITGAKRLKILVDYGQNLDTGDWLNLCDARIVK